MDDQFDWELLDRFLAGDSTPAEASRIEAWLTANPARRKYFEGLRQAFEVTGAEGRWETDGEWGKLADRTRVEPRPEPSPLLTLVGSSRRHRLWIRVAPVMRVAAMILLLAGAGVSWWAIVLRTPARPQPETPAAKIREYTTARGQRADMLLNDGTRVKLGAESKLWVPEDFGLTERRVVLQGHAYFDVTHDDAKPFTVRAGNAIARDLGTRFSVRAYPEEPRVDVIVAEGKVAVATADPAGPSPEPSGDSLQPVTPRDIIVTPGQMARVKADGGIAIRTGVELDRYLGWTHGKLVFRAAPLTEVAAELSRWYGVEVRLTDDEVRGKQLSATFDDAPLSEALHLLEVSLEVTVQRVGNVVKIRRRETQRAN